MKGWEGEHQKLTNVDVNISVCVRWGGGGGGANHGGGVLVGQSCHQIQNEKSVFQMTHGFVYYYHQHAKEVNIVST